MTELWTPADYQAHIKAVNAPGARYKRYAGRKRKTATPESNVKKACIALLYTWGCDVISTPTGAAFRFYTDKSGEERRYCIRFGKTGLGDIVACSPSGRYVEVETKSAIGEQREKQIERQQEVERRKGVYVLARSVDDLIGRQAEILA